MLIEKDVDRIRLLAKENEDDNWRFRAYLKGARLSTAALDRIVWRHLEIVMSKIDCRACANCCKVMSPILSARDVRRLAEHLGISKTQIIDDYLRPSEEKSKYRFQTVPCRFLQEQGCSVYDSRPDDCRSFPHLHKREFRSRLIGVIENCFICPIVYNVFEGLKSDLWRSSRRGW